MVFRFYAICGFLGCELPDLPVCELQLWENTGNKGPGGADRQSFTLPTPGMALRFGTPGQDASGEPQDGRRRLGSLTLVQPVRRTVRARLRGSVKQPQLKALSG